MISPATSSQPGEPGVHDMSALTIKIPEPIIEPMINADESTRLRLFLKDGWPFCDMYNYV